MTTKNIIRAWRDAAYRNSPKEIERAELPVAGELTTDELALVSGGSKLFEACCKGTHPKEVVIHMY